MFSDLFVKRWCNTRASAFAFMIHQTMRSFLCFIFPIISLEKLQLLAYDTSDCDKRDMTSRLFSIARNLQVGAKRLCVENKKSQVHPVMTTTCRSDRPGACGWLQLWTCVTHLDLFLLCFGSGNKCGHRGNASWRCTLPEIGARLPRAMVDYF